MGGQAPHDSMTDETSRSTTRASGALVRAGRRRRWRRSAGGVAAPAAAPVRRVLLLRLERIGDLLMVLDAIRDARAAWPDAEIDLAVGSWNRAAGAADSGHHAHRHARRAVAGARRSRRDVAGADRPRARLARAQLRPRDQLRARHPQQLPRVADGRAAAVRLLDRRRRRVPDGRAGVRAARARRRERAAAGRARGRPDRRRVAGAGAPAAAARCRRPKPSRRRRALLAGAARPLVGVHASGGRDRNSGTSIGSPRSAGGWPIARRDDRADRLGGRSAARRCGAIAAWPARASSTPAARLDLPALAALLARLDVLVTGDTGPMHLAAAMGTPVVALFGPSAPWRYGPLAARQRVLRVDLPCSPCGQVRLPPERCRGHVPDCMDGIQVDDGRARPPPNCWTHGARGGQPA